MADGVGLRRLPEAIATVVIPEFFHPSEFTRLERCALSVLGMIAAGNDNGFIATHPKAVLGTILHHVRREVMDGRWGHFRDPVEAALYTFDEAVEAVESTFLSDEATSGLVPLYSSVGRRTWKQRLQELRAWASSQIDVSYSDEDPRALTLERSSLATDGRARPGGEPLGVERPLEDAALRLRGRPDWSAIIGRGRIHVVDFKSGRLTDANGSILDQYATQVRLYALMIERRYPNVVVTPFVERVERLEVPWDEGHRSSVLERLRAVSRRLPVEVELEAGLLAVPGPHCTFCRIRPRCQVYLESAPAWWKVQSHVAHLPLDVWGRVINVESVPRRDAAELWVVHLLDDAGRHVRIDGLMGETGVGNLSAGEMVYFFELESSEDLGQHGSLVQPRNFHQVPPGPRWDKARRARIFGL